MALVNVWHLRKVADASSKPCDICYKPTTSVLITPDNKVRLAESVLCYPNLVQDYFYVCSGHLKDKGLATPIIDEAEVAAKKKKEEMDREIEIIKKEYEEKMKLKKSKGKGKEGKSVDKGEGKDDASKSEDVDKKAEKEKDAKVPFLTALMQLLLSLLKINAITTKQSAPVNDGLPRIYALQKYEFHH